MDSKERKNKYDQKFHKENYTRISLMFRNGSDDCLLEKLKSVENKTDYIRQLILDDIEKGTK